MSVCMCVSVCLVSRFACSKFNMIICVVYLFTHFPFKIANGSSVSKAWTPSTAGIGQFGYSENRFMPAQSHEQFYLPSPICGVWESPDILLDFSITQTNSFLALVFHVDGITISFGATLLQFKQKRHFFRGRMMMRGSFSIHCVMRFSVQASHHYWRSDLFFGQMRLCK